MTTTDELPLTRASVSAAHAIIAPHVHLTPVQTNTTLSTLASTPQTADALKGSPWEGHEPARPKIRLFFKCENFQRIGAFKARGAFHAVKRLIEKDGLDEVRKRGVVTHSSGMSFCCFTQCRNMSDLSAQETMHKPSPSLRKHSISPPTSSCPPSRHHPKSQALGLRVRMYTSAGLPRKNARRSWKMSYATQAPP